MMEDDTVMCKLVQLMFHKPNPFLSEMTSTDSTSPASISTKHFHESLKIVLRTKRILVLCRYKTFIDTCCYKMFASHEMYLRYVMYACHAEHICHNYVFESFISVCAILLNISVETKDKTGMDLSDLNLEVFAVFYQMMMHKPFKKAGGLEGFAKYIFGHEYLKKFDNEDLTIMRDLGKDKISLDELFEGSGLALTANHDEIENDFTCTFLAKKVLSKTSVELPALLSKRELIENLVAYRRVNIAKNDEKETASEAASDYESLKNGLEKSKILERVLKTKLKATPGDKRRNDIVLVDVNFKPSSKKGKAKQKLDSTENEKVVPGLDSKSNFKSEPTLDFNIKVGIVQGTFNSNSNSCSKANDEAESKEDVPENENIFQAVMRYNRSENVSHTRADKRILKKAEAVLNHLKISIQSLIKVLDEYN